MVYRRTIFRVVSCFVVVYYPRRFFVLRDRKKWYSWGNSKRENNDALLAGYKT
jgi:hypothetical protein